MRIARKVSKARKVKSKSRNVRKTSLKKINKSVRQSRNPSRPSAGWREIAPRLRSERRALLSTCGPDCFLDPENLKFPICSNKMDCVIQCSGIDSASVRAGQYKHQNILKTSRNMYQKYCKN